MNNSIKFPTWLYVVAAIAVLWNVVGVWTYISTMTMTAEALAMMPEAQQQIHNATPAWANGAFAIAVFAGLLGSILLLLKKALAYPVLLISLVAILIQMFNAFFIMNSFDVFGPGVVIMPIMVIVIAALLVWIAKYTKNKNWIN